VYNLHNTINNISIDMSLTYLKSHDGTDSVGTIIQGFVTLCLLCSVQVTHKQIAINIKNVQV